MPQTDSMSTIGSDSFLTRIREAEREADAILADARAEADRLLALAREEADATVAAARLRAAGSRRSRIVEAERTALEIRSRAEAEARVEAERVEARFGTGDDAAVQAVAERIVKRHVDR